MAGARQKYKFRYKQEVQVKVRRHNQEPIWLRGWIKDLHGKGASVQITEGRLFSDFFNWSDVRELPASETPSPPVSIPIAKLADVMPASLTLVPQPAATPPPPAVLITREELDNMAAKKSAATANNSKLVQLRAPITIGGGSDGEEEKAPAAAPLSQTAPRAPSKPFPLSASMTTTTTQIGRIIREHRLANAMSQMALAEKLDPTNQALNNSRVSQLELGKVIANDDELLAIASVFGLDLDNLMELRNKDLDRRRAKQPPPSRVAQLAAATTPLVLFQESSRAPQPPPVAPVAAASPAPAPAPAPPAAAQQQASVAAPEGGFEDFVEKLCDLVPVPADRDQRKLWFAMARKFFELSGE